MPRRTIDAVLDVFEDLKKNGITEKVSSPVLIRYIRTHCGARQDVIRRYLDFMKVMNFIRDAGEEGPIPQFIINWAEVDAIAAKL